MELKHKINIVSGSESVKNNMLESLHLYSLENKVFKVVAEMESRNFQIIAESSDDESQGICIDYSKNEKEYLLSLDLEGFSSQKYNMLIDRDKEVVTLLFIPVESMESVHVQSVNNLKKQK